MQSANYAMGQVATDVCLTNLKNQRLMLGILESSPASQFVLEQLRKHGPAGGFAPSLVLPHLGQQALSPTDGYSTFESLPSSVVDPTLSAASYSQPLDLPIIFKANRMVVAANYIPTVDLMTHAAGRLLPSQLLVNNQNQIGDILEQGIVADMDSSTQFASATAGNGNKFVLDTSSQAAFQSSMGLLLAAFSKQNIPPDQRYIWANSTLESVVVKHAALVANRDLVDRSAGDVAAGRLVEFAGFKWVFSNNVPAATAIAVSPVKYAFVIPLGLQLESLKDIVSIGDFTRLYSICGFGSISEVVQSYNGDAVTLNAQRVGLISCSVS